MEQRFDLRKERDGTWTVFDVLTGMPVLVNDVRIDGLEIEEAEHMADFLNSLDAQRRMPSGT